MTRFLEREIACALCGSRSPQQVLLSTNTLGWADLDLRPPEMKRSTMIAWVQECPACGYCAPALESALPGAVEVTTADAYRTLLADEGLPRLARRFLCLALLQEPAGHWLEGAASAQHAAWACDDAQSDRAPACRRLALQYLGRASEEGKSPADDPATDAAIRADLARRSGDLEVAREWCVRGLQARGPEDAWRVLRFQQQLIRRGDLACHTLEEVFSPRPASAP